jgi:hypothetical protein
VHLVRYDADQVLDQGGEREVSSTALGGAATVSEWIENRAVTCGDRMRSESEAQACSFRVLDERSAAFGAGPLRSQRRLEGCGSAFALGNGLAAIVLAERVAIAQKTSVTSRGASCRATKCHA